MAAVSWKEKEYTLADVKDMTLPCVVKITEGYQGEGESDTFSRDDIIKIDEYTVLQKVKANFVADSDGNKVMFKDDIQIPLNYKGKLRVIQPAKEYSNIAELADGSPRYAKFLETVKVPIPYAGGGQMIQANAVAEIDRVLPAKQGKETSLIMTVGGKSIQLPLNFKAKSMAVADENEYVLQEVIDRFKLPRTIRFSDNKVKEVFERNLRDGVGNMSHITGTLRLKELTEQEVLIGHYKGEEIAGDAVTAIVRRSVVVIPLREFGDTGIQILEDKNKSDFIEFLTISFPSTQGIKFVDGSLYAEFTRRPMVYKISETVDEADDVADSGSKVSPVKDDPLTPPRLPPRPEFQPPLNQTSVTGHSKRTGIGTKTIQSRTMPPPFKLMPFSPAVKTPSSFYWIRRAVDDVDLHTSTTPSRAMVVRSASQRSMPNMKKGADDGYMVMRAQFREPPENVKLEEVKELPETQGTTHRHGHRKSRKEKLKALFLRKPQSSRSTFESHISQSQDEICEKTNTDLSLEDARKDDADLYVDLVDVGSATGSPPPNAGKLSTAVVHPGNIPGQAPDHNVKPVSELSVTEMEKRLEVCGLAIFAKVCKEHKLDGNYIVSMDKAELKGYPFYLTKFEISKLERIIKNNWVPHQS